MTSITNNELNQAVLPHRANQSRWLTSGDTDERKWTRRGMRMEYATRGRVWWFRPQNHPAGLVVSSSKPSAGFGGFVLKTIGGV
jgi:hypothetical protein